MVFIQINNDNMENESILNMPNPKYNFIEWSKIKFRSLIISIFKKNKSDSKFTVSKNISKHDANRLLNAVLDTQLDNIIDLEDRDQIYFSWKYIIWVKNNEIKYFSKVDKICDKKYLEGETPSHIIHKSDWKKYLIFHSFVEWLVELPGIGFWLNQSINLLELDPNFIKFEVLWEKEKVIVKNPDDFRLEIKDWKVFLIYKDKNKEQLVHRL